MLYNNSATSISGNDSIVSPLCLIIQTILLTLPLGSENQYVFNG